MSKRKTLKKIFEYRDHISSSSQVLNFWYDLEPKNRIAIKTLYKAPKDLNDHRDKGITTITIRYKESAARSKLREGLTKRDMPSLNLEDDYDRLRSPSRENY